MQAKYSRKFKQDASKLVIEREYTCQQAENSLWVSLSAIRRCVSAEQWRYPREALKRYFGLAEHEELIRLHK
ncbi:hypothetical protein [Candidatus Williamhamiltonella defendens]|uniref:hypothetical protein n=1 Tax=Candidatus Williamhamiltonella defendens TaxID=138072 RepID=UPI00130D6CA3|nr:hypothetical protein [Candidatus Hamiltonella defensa]